MIFVCDKCRFIFSRTVEPEQCSDCGKYAVRLADEAERLEYEKHLNKICTGMANKANPQQPLQRAWLLERDFNNYYSIMQGEYSMSQEERILALKKN